MDDEDAVAGGDALSSLRRAAVREASEEVGVALLASDLIHVSRWKAPEEVKRRFDAWFFAARVDSSDVEVDGSEIIDAQWLTPKRALQLHEEGRLRLNGPPVFITLTELLRMNTCREALAFFSDRVPEEFQTRLCFLKHGIIALYHGDAGYEAKDHTLEGPRHRLTMLGPKWVYERDS